MNHGTAIPRPTFWWHVWWNFRLAWCAFRLLDFESDEVQALVEENLDRTVRRGK